MIPVARIYEKEIIDGGVMTAEEIEAHK